MEKKKIYVAIGIVVVCIGFICLVLVSNTCGKDDKSKVEETTAEENTAEEVSTEVVTEESTTESIAEIETTKQPETTKEETTTIVVNNETTTKPTEPQTTSKVEETTKQPETTTKKEVVYDLSEDNRIKNYELQLISRLREFDRWDDSIGDYVPCTMYERVKEKKYSPYLQALDLGWENILPCGGAGLRNPEEEVDDFSVKHPNDSRASEVERNLQWSKKYLGAIINDCENWVKDGTKTSAKDFQDYLVSKYTYNGTNSIFTDAMNSDGYLNDEYMGRTKEFCEQWCYYDNTDKQYKPNFGDVFDFAVYTYEKNGYFDNVNEMIKWVQFTGDGTYDETYGYGCKYYRYGGMFVRWTYNKDTDKTIIYMVFMDA